MTLTTDDLQAIGTIIDEKLSPIKEELDSHGTSLKYLKKKVNRMNKTLDIVAITYDQRLVANKKEIDRLKDLQ